MSLTKEDIILVHNIIEVCQKRGAFQASEMTLVGKLFEKVQKMVETMKAEEAKKGEEQKQTESQASATPLPTVTKLN